MASLVQPIHDGRRWFLQSNLEDYVVAWAFAMPRYYYDRLLAAVIRQPLYLGGLELIWCPELSPQTLRVLFRGVESFLTWDQETAIAALLMPSQADEPTRHSLTHSLYCLLFLIAMTAPVFPSLSSFHQQDDDAQWVTGPLSELPAVASSS